MLQIGEIATVLDNYGKYGVPALVLLVYVVWSRTELCRVVTWVVVTDLRYRYLKRRGYSKKELHAWLHERDKAWSEATRLRARRPALLRRLSGKSAQKATG